MAAALAGAVWWAGTRLGASACHLSEEWQGPPYPKQVGFELGSLAARADETLVVEYIPSSQPVGTVVRITRCGVREGHLLMELAGARP